jgi:HSP20 family protein
MATFLPRLFGDMFGDVGDWFETGFPGRHQLIRVEDKLTDTEYVLRAELPGLHPEKDIQISINHGVLTIKAERSGEEKTATRTEFHYGTLYRSVRLPGSADEEHITATYAKGILEVTVPLTATEPAGRQIPVSHGE